MKKLGESSLRRFKKGSFIEEFLLVGCICVLLGGLAFYKWDHRRTIEKSIHLVLKANRTIEYGAAYNPLDFVKKASGDVKVVSSTVDTHKIGEGEVTFEVAKENVSKQITVKVEVTDQEGPVIALKEENITLYKGDTYAPLQNILSVEDDVDGVLPYAEMEEKGHYTIIGTPNLMETGSYSIHVKAVDKSGNSTEASYTIQVIDRPTIYSNKEPSGNMAALMEALHSLLGSPYVAGGFSKAGFDCSGLVAYAYSQIGISIPRSTSGQWTVGVRVDRKNIRPGDILVWSANGNTPTHTGIYIGNGQMIHAANPRKGVIISTLSSWPETLLAVRRI